MKSRSDKLRQQDWPGVNREALIKAYDVLVKTPEDRKTVKAGP